MTGGSPSSSTRLSKGDADAAGRPGDGHGDAFCEVAGDMGHLVAKNERTGEMTTQRDIDEYSGWADAGGDASQGRDGGDSYGWATADDLVNSIVGAGDPSFQQAARPQAEAVPEVTPQRRPEAVPQMVPEVAPQGPQGPTDRQAPARRERTVAPDSVATTPAGDGGEYGAWDYQRDDAAGGIPFGGGEEPGRGQILAMGNPLADELASRRPDPHARRDRGGERPATTHFESGDKAGRRGRFTSVLALAFALASLVAALSPALLTAVDQEQWILALLGALPVTALCAVPALLLGLRSATKPREQLGKGRGIVAIAMCAVSLVVATVLVVTRAKGMVDELNMNGVVAKEQTNASTMTLVFPGGKLELGNEAIRVLMQAGVLPDSTLDNGAIPISSQNGKVYVGSREIDTEVIRQYSSYVSPEASQQTLGEIVEGVEALSQHNFAITTDGDTITLRGKGGGQYTITWDDLAERSDGGTGTAGVSSSQGGGTQPTEVAADAVTGAAGEVSAGAVAQGTPQAQPGTSPVA